MIQFIAKRKPFPFISNSLGYSTDCFYGLFSILSTFLTVHLPNQCAHARVRYVVNACKAKQG